jgi:hypothetical protein
MVTIREFREYKAKGTVGHDRHASLESATESSQAVYMGYQHDQRKWFFRERGAVVMVGTLQVHQRTSRALEC